MVIDLYAKYIETHQRLRPPNTLQPELWNDLPPWLQAVWVELAIWISDQPIELAYSSPEDQEQGWRRVVFASETDDDGNCPHCGVDYADCPCPGPTMEDEYEYKEVDGVLYARRRNARPGSN